MKKMWRRFLVAGCVAALLMTAPGMTVLAEEIQEEILMQEEGISAAASEGLTEENKALEAADTLAAESGTSETFEAAENETPETADAIAADDGTSEAEETFDTAETTDPEASINEEADPETPDAAEEPEAIEEEPETTEPTEEKVPGDIAADTAEPAPADEDREKPADAVQDISEAELLPVDESGTTTEETVGMGFFAFQDVPVGEGVFASMYVAGYYGGNNGEYIVTKQLTITSPKNGTLASDWKDTIRNELPNDPEWVSGVTGISCEAETGKLFFPEDSSYLFAGFTNATSISFSNIDTSRVVNMEAMFKDCQKVENLDVSGFNTSKVVDMSYMFSYCYMVQNPNLTKFDTQNVTDMSYMFLSSGIQSPNLSSFNTSKVTNMCGMFQNCMALNELDLSNFDTTKLKYCDLMFSDDINLKILNLSSFDMSSAVNYQEYGLLHMLYDCAKLELVHSPKKNNKKIALYVTMYDPDGNAYNALPITSKSITLTLKKETHINLSKATVGGISLSYGYKGSAYTPAFRVIVNGKELKAGTDFTYKFTNNVMPGTAKLTITGKGKYTGTRVKTFEIVDCVSKLVSGNTYTIVPKNNSKTAVCPVSGKMVNNSQVYITDRSASEAMRFKAIQKADGTWKFINSKCELALAVQQNSSAVGKGVVIYNQTNKKAQNWKLVKKSDNSFAIINAVSGLSIAMSNSAAMKGTTLSMAKTASSGLQRFYLVNAKPVNTPYKGTYSIRASKNQKYGVNISGASLKEGANVNLNLYSNTSSKTFQFIYSGGGYYRIRNLRSGMVLTANKRNNRLATSTNVVQRLWAGSNEQRWKVTVLSDGSVRLTNAAGFALHLSGNKAVSGTNIQARIVSSTGAQRWYMKRISSK